MMKLHKPFPRQVLVFKCLQYQSLENTAGKGEIDCKEQFLLFPQCFLPIWEKKKKKKKSAIFIKFEFVVCKLFQFGRVKFVVWESVKPPFASNTDISNMDLSFNYANIHAISPMIYHFDIQRIFLEQKLISHGYF